MCKINIKLVFQYTIESTLKLISIKVRELKSTFGDKNGLKIHNRDSPLLDLTYV